MKNYIFNKILSTFLIIQVLFVNYISRHPDLVEKYYSNGIYKVISGFFRRLLGRVPISIGDIFYLILLLLIIRWIWLVIKTRFSPFRKHLYTAGAFISVLLFAFNMLWGFNYYREPLSKRLGYSNTEYSLKDLKATTDLRIMNLNTIHTSLTKNDSAVVEIPYKKRAIYKMARNEYQQLYPDSLDLHFKVKSIKHSLFSVPISYMGFSGYLNPFSGEAQVNRKIPLSSYPITTTHEMAHQLGYASENEANYIGYLACIHSENMYFQYSAELMAVKYLLNEIGKNDPEYYKQSYKILHFGIQKDMQSSHDFWDSFHTPIAPASKKIYDTYLKVNNQKEGIESYSSFIGYLVNEKATN